MIKISKVAQCRLSITLRLNVTLTLYHASKIDSNQDPGSGSRSIEWLQYLKIFPDTESGSGYGSTPNVNQDTHQISVKSLCNIFETFLLDFPSLEIFLIQKLNLSPVNLCSYDPLLSVCGPVCFTLVNNRSFFTSYPKQDGTCMSSFTGKHGFSRHYACLGSTVERQN